MPDINDNARDDIAPADIVYRNIDIERYSSARACNISANQFGWS